MRTKLVYGNCLLGGMYLVLRGKVKRAALVSSHSFFVPAHIVIESKKGRVLHFRYFVEQNPLYFKGYFEGIKLSEVDKYLKKEKRKVILVLKPWTFFSLSLVLFFVLLAPWSLYWPLEVLAWRIPRDIFKLAKRRLSRLVFNRSGHSDRL